ncbi:hypothetical protein JTB14_018030 [Gonioctena quinquepunctata]|nr:hypothetical protein JTB14_018030 [Gonioctena quinquepunctata]
MQMSLLITFDRKSHRIFLSTDGMGCFLCKKKRHLAANCPHINTANELPSDNTQTRNIGNGPPVATNIQTEQTAESPQPGQKRGQRSRLMTVTRPNLTPPNPQI